ncbi:response regulator [Marinifilum caeruleilacunae]|uniref:Response regulator n=1 Tax=Marinifilum caeruleilacunae TaxID=2499076 RepID=A0ABX1WXB7_9BACT|nr:response regulator [Marinifilum caeruleilacunae]NOU60775.1 response regulator [Marinifilum caeruleilacunae]
MNTKTFNWSEKTILIAEDVESNYLFLEEVLGRTGANIIWATNGQNAIDIFTQNDIDLILMDIQMPLLNGFDATRAIKKIDPKVPVISQTAYAMAEDRGKSIAAGCDDYISKPISSQKLLSLIDKYL